MVRGKLKFQDPGAVPSGQRIKLSIQDTSRIGADAEDVAETMLTIPEDFDAETDTLPFEIDLEEIGDGLTLRAHMPCHEGSDVRAGDMITTEAIPVLQDDDVSVTLRRI